MAEQMKADLGWRKNDPRIVPYRQLRPRKGVEHGIDETVHILTALLGLKESPRLVTVGHAEPWQTGKRRP